MNTYQKIMYTGILGVAVGSASLVSATAPTTALASTTKPVTSVVKQNSLAYDIAKTYHLSPLAVQSTIKQYNKTHHHKSHHKIGYKKRLNMAVKHGKITSTQEQAIISEHAQLKQVRKADKGQSKTQKKANMKAERAKIKAWAKSNNVPARLVF